MATFFRKLFSPLLKIFESGNEPFSYSKSHRTILIVMGVIFLLLSIGLAALGFYFALLGAVIPAGVFFAVAVTALVVGLLGTDRAVSKIWGTKSV